MAETSLWPAWGPPRVRCVGGGDVHTVRDQAICQLVAKRRNHAYYQFLQNVDKSGECATAAFCAAPFEDPDHQEWRMFRRPQRSAVPVAPPTPLPYPIGPAVVGASRSSAETGHLGAAQSSAVSSTASGKTPLVEAHRSSSLRYSDLTDSERFGCTGRQRSNLAPHPQLEFDRPHHLVHVHLEDRAAYPHSKVLWDAIYDMGGTEVLKGSAKALKGSSKAVFEGFCPPPGGPPHWYELTVRRASSIGPVPAISAVSEAWPHGDAVDGAVPSPVADFIGSQIVDAYGPEHHLVFRSALDTLQAAFAKRLAS